MKNNKNKPFAQIKIRFYYKAYKKLIKSLNSMALLREKLKKEKGPKKENIFQEIIKNIKTCNDTNIR